MKMKWFRGAMAAWIVGATALQFVASAEAAVSEHNIYEIGSNRKHLLFRMKRIEEGSTIRNVYTYPDGKEAVDEQIVLENGRIKSIRIEQKQLGETYSAAVTGNKVKYVRTIKGKTEKSDDDMPDNVLIGPQIVTYAQKHWDELMKGERKPFRVMAVDRQDTFGFEVYREKDKDKDKDKAESDNSVITMLIKPTSPFISMAVKPIAFRFDADTHKLKSVIGRVAPRLRKGDGWADLDAEMTFE